MSLCPIQQRPSHNTIHSACAVSSEVKQKEKKKREPTYEPLPQELLGLSGPGLRLLFLSPQAGCFDAGQVHPSLLPIGFVPHHKAVPTHNLADCPSELVTQLCAWTSKTAEWALLHYKSPQHILREWYKKVVRRQAKNNILLFATW